MSFDRRAAILGLFAYFAKSDLDKLVRRARERGVEVDFMADSGAFTAYTTGKTMTLDVIGDPAASGRNTAYRTMCLGVPA